MGPVPAVAPQPRAGATKGTLFAGGETRDDCAHPAAAPAPRWPDEALHALLGSDRHAALLLSVAWVAAYSVATRVRKASACALPSLTPGHDTLQGTQAAAQSLLYVATSEVALRFTVRRTAVVLRQHFRGLSSEDKRKRRSAPRIMRSDVALTR